jgi:sterol 3beta-glucosyltransferase
MLQRKFSCASTNPYGRLEASDGVLMVCDHRMADRWWRLDAMEIDTDKVIWLRDQGRKPSSSRPKLHEVPSNRLPEVSSPRQKAVTLISILALGSYGDVAPYVALGVGLRGRGFAIRVACSEPFRDLVQVRGLQHATLPGDPRAALASDRGQAWLAANNPISFTRGLVSLGNPDMERYLEAVTAACDGADAILYGPLGFAGFHIGQARRIPTALAQLQPTESTREFPSFSVPVRSLGSMGNRISHLLLEQIAWQLLRAPVNRWRVERLGLPPLPLSGPWKELRGRANPILYAYSPTVLPRPADWPSHVHVTGYWVLDPEPGWEPADDLATFLAGGPPPVYVGFGSMVWRDEAEAWRAVRAALRQAGVRAVLAGGPPTLADDAVHIVGDIPHAWLFPRMAAVVHHGGAGTTGAGLRAGVPAVVCPFFADQPFWGRRVHALGAGPLPVPARRMSAARLERAISEAVHDPAMRQRAAALSERIRREDGVGQAGAIIERWLDRVAR